MKFLDMKKIQSRPVWLPNHMQKLYKNCQTYLIEKSLKLWENSLCLPSFPQMEVGVAKNISKHILEWVSTMKWSK